MKLYLKCVNKEKYYFCKAFGTCPEVYTMPKMKSFSFCMCHLSLGVPLIPLKREDMALSAAHRAW